MTSTQKAEAREAQPLAPGPPLGEWQGHWLSLTTEHELLTRLLSQAQSQDSGQVGSEGKEEARQTGAKTLT